MLSSLVWGDLPTDISLWPGMPLSLSGDEVIPLDYRAGHSGWLLYGNNLDKQRLSDYQCQLGTPMVIVHAWRIEGYQVVRLAGTLMPSATKLAHEFALDVAPLGKIPHPEVPGLLVMDMDSTAIQIECIDQIARLAGCGEQVAAITEKAMLGKVDFRTSLRQRVAALAGTDAQIVEQVKNDLTLTPGLISLLQRLQAVDWKVVIASGGFTHYASYLQEKLNLTAFAANQLEIVEGKLTGRLIGPLVDGSYKANMLLKLAERYQIAFEQTVAIGDGANDLPMLQAAAMGIAFNAKPNVNKKARFIIRYADLMGVYCILSANLFHEER